MLRDMLVSSSTPFGTVVNTGSPNLLGCSQDVIICVHNLLPVQPKEPWHENLDYTPRYSIQGGLH